MKAEYITQQKRGIKKFFSQITRMSFWSCSALTGDASCSALKHTASHKFKIILNLCGSAIKRRRIENYLLSYRGADKSLARPTSEVFCLVVKNISFYASLVIYI